MSVSLDDEAESSMVRVKGGIALALIPPPTPVLPPTPAAGHVHTLPPAPTPTPALPSTPTPIPALVDRECTVPEGSSFEMKASDSCTIFLPVVTVAGCLDCSVLECVLVEGLFVFEAEDEDEEEAG